MRRCGTDKNSRGQTHDIDVSYESDFMMSLNDDKQTEIIDAFNATCRYLDDILNMIYIYFDNMVNQI